MTTNEHMAQSLLARPCGCDDCKSGNDDHRLSLNKLAGIDLDDLESRAQSWEVSPMHCACEDCGGMGPTDRAWGMVEKYC